MTKTSLSLTCGLAIAIAAAGSIAGCGHKDSPTAPAPLPTSVTSLSVSGNTVLTAPGQTSQFRAQATMSDGSTKDVTALSDWFSSNVGVITVATGGLATARALGKANVNANFRGKGGSAVTVTVLPEGTTIIAGSVTESGSYPVPDARVEAIGGPMSGLAATTDALGKFALNGMSGVTEVRATKDGYQPATQSVPQDTEHVAIVLTPVEARAPIAGTYRLTFTVSPSCHLPDDAMTRTYTARIDQDGPLVTVTLSDAQFGTYFGATWNKFSGRVSGQTVQFTLNGGYDAIYDGGVAEQLGAAGYLMLSGTATAQIARANISAALAGAVSLISSPQAIWAPTASCSAPDHQLVFSPR